MEGKKIRYHRLTVFTCTLALCVCAVFGVLIWRSVKSLLPPSDAEWVTQSMNRLLGRTTDGHGGVSDAVPPEDAIRRLVLDQVDFRVVGALNGIALVKVSAPDMIKVTDWITNDMEDRDKHGDAFNGTNEQLREIIAEAMGEFRRQRITVTLYVEYQVKDSVCILTENEELVRALYGGMPDFSDRLYELFNGE